MLHLINTKTTLRLKGQEGRGPQCDARFSCSFSYVVGCLNFSIEVTFTLFRHSIELQPEASPTVVSLWVNTNKLSLYSFVKETNNSRTLVIIRMKDL